MIYELRNKVPQNSSFIYSEDVLTGTLFGNLRYFSSQEIMVNFLNQSTDIGNRNLALDTKGYYTINFWEKYTTADCGKINEPDLVLSNRENVILIECKYFSALSEEGNIVYDKEAYNNQLLRYSKIIEEYYANRANKIIVFLTNDTTKPVDLLKNTLEKLDPGIQLYWLSWAKLYKCMKNYDTSGLKDNEILLYNDMLNFLKKRKLTGFYGFEINDIFSGNFFHKTYCFTKDIAQKSIWRFKHE
jgi:hypothetical protein